VPQKQRITLRVGMFFDGTLNNLPNASLTAQCRREDLAQLGPDGLEAVLGSTPEACLMGVDLMVVLADECQVAALAPDSAAVAELPGRGLIVTASATEVDFVSRFFAPSCGIAEDPVTGSAHCSLTPYWAERLGRSDLVARQLSARGGMLHCQLVEDRVLISGRVIPYLSGVIHIDC